MKNQFTTMLHHCMRLFTIVVFLLAGLGQMRAIEEGNDWHSITGNPYIYFDNTESEYTNVSFLIGRHWNYNERPIGSEAISMTAIPNTNLYYKQINSWEYFNTFAFIDANWNSWETNTVTARAGYAAHHTNTYNTTMSGNLHLFTPQNNENDASLSYKSADTKDKLLSEYQDIKISISTNGGSTYTELSGTTPAYRQVSGYSLNSETTVKADENHQDKNNTYSSKRKALCLASTTTMTIRDVVAGYVFVGFYDAETGGNLLKSAAESESSTGIYTYTYTVRGATTVWARFMQVKNITVKIDRDNRNGWVHQGITTTTVPAGATCASSDDGGWFKLVFSNVAAVTALDLAYAGGDWDVTGLNITEDICYNFDQSVNSECIIGGGGDDPTSGTWEIMANGAPAGTFTNNGDGTYTLSHFTLTDANRNAIAFRRNGTTNYKTGNGNLTTEKTMTDGAGNFQWQTAPAGDYTLTIRNDNGTWKVVAAAAAPTTYAIVTDFTGTDLAQNWGTYDMTKDGGIWKYTTTLSKGRTYRFAVSSDNTAVDLNKLLFDNVNQTSALKATKHGTTDFDFTVYLPGSVTITYDPATHKMAINYTPTLPTIYIHAAWWGWNAQTDEYKFTKNDYTYTYFVQGRTYDDSEGQNEFVLKYGNGQTIYQYEQRFYGAGVVAAANGERYHLDHVGLCDATIRVEISNVDGKGTVSATYDTELRIDVSGVTKAYEITRPNISLSPVYSNAPTPGTTYTWSITGVTGSYGAITSDAHLSATNVAAPEFYADKSGTYTCKVIANNGTSEKYETFDIVVTDPTLYISSASSSFTAPSWTQGNTAIAMTHVAGTNVYTYTHTYDDTNILNFTIRDGENLSTSNVVYNDGTKLDLHNDAGFSFVRGTVSSNCQFQLASQPKVVTITLTAHGTRADLDFASAELPTYYMKHNWNNAGGEWPWKQLTDKGNGIYSIVDYYGGTGCNYNTRASNDGSGWVAEPTLIGEPQIGDMCVFTYNSSNNAITIEKAAAWALRYDNETTPASYTKIGDFELQADGSYILTFELTSANHQLLSFLYQGETHYQCNDVTAADANNIPLYSGVGGNCSFNGEYGFYTLVITYDNGWIINAQKRETTDVKIAYTSNSAQVGAATVTATQSRTSASISSSNQTAKTITAVVGDQVTYVAEPAPEGYFFAGWYDQSGGDNSRLKTTNYTLTETVHSGDNCNRYARYVQSNKIYYCYKGQSINLPEDLGSGYKWSEVKPKAQAARCSITGNTFTGTTCGRILVEATKDASPTVVAIVYVYQYYIKYAWGSCGSTGAAYNAAWIWKPLAANGDGTYSFTGSKGDTYQNGSNVVCNIGWDYDHDWADVYQADGAENTHYNPGDTYPGYNYPTTIEEESCVVGGKIDVKNVTNYPGSLSCGEPADWTFTPTAEPTASSPFTLGGTVSVAPTTKTTYTVTYAEFPSEQGIVTATSGVSGNKVLSGTSVTFTATEKNLSDAFIGWYDNPSCTGAAISTEHTYTTTITADYTIYAKFDYSAGTLIYVNSDWGTVKLYTWNTKHNGDWPGEALSKIDEAYSWYAVMLNSGSANFQLNIGTASKKTGDLTTSSYADNSLWVINTSNVLEAPTLSLSGTCPAVNGKVTLTTTTNVLGNVDYTYYYSWDNGAHWTIIADPENFTATQLGTLKCKVVASSGPWDAEADTEVEVAERSVSLTADGYPNEWYFGNTVTVRATTQSDIASPNYTFEVKEPGTRNWVQFYSGTNAAPTYKLLTTGDYKFRVTLNNVEARTSTGTQPTDEQDWTSSPVAMFLRYAFAGTGNDDWKSVEMTYDEQEGTYIYYEVSGSAERPISYYRGSNAGTAAVPADVKFQKANVHAYGDPEDSNLLNIETNGIDNPNVSTTTLVVWHYDPNTNRLWITSTSNVLFRLKSVSSLGTFYSNSVPETGGQISYFAKTDGTLTWQVYGTSDSPTDWTDVNTISGQPTKGGFWANTYPAISEDNVYVGTMSCTSAQLTILDNAVYDGDFYIYCSATSWEAATIVSNNGTMTDFSATTDTYYDHYWVRYITPDTDVRATVGNLINTDLANALPRRIVEARPNPNPGDLLGANVRFEYKPTNNLFQRTMISASADEGWFVKAYGTNITTMDDAAITSTTNAAVFTDGSDWMYSLDVKAVIGASEHATLTIISNYNNEWKWICSVDGSEGGAGATKDIFTSDKAGTYNLRIYYDYKTNRITAGWMPADVDDDIVVDGDLIIYRIEDQAPTIINLQNNHTITGINKLTTILELRRDHIYNGDGSFTSANKQMFWISLPYDCNVSDIYGIEGYGDKWYIEAYMGDMRAMISWYDFIPTWWSMLYDDEVMYANQGYVVVLDGLARSEFETIGDKSSKFLFFPSAEGNFSIEPTDLVREVELEEYACNVTTPQNRTKLDSDWHVFGVPGLMDAKIASATGQTIHTNPETGEPFEENWDQSIAQGLRYYYSWKNGTYSIEDITYNSTEFTPTFAYMVQYHGTISWTTQADVVAHAPALLMANNSTASTKSKFCLQLYGDDNQLVDQSFVVLSEQGTSDYVIGDDLLKIFTGDAQIYTEGAGVELAANEVELQTESVPVGTVFGVSGEEYMFHLRNDGRQPMLAYLYDTQENRYIDLQQEDYWFTSEAGKSANRFHLFFEAREGEIDDDTDWSITTGTEEQTMQVALVNGRIILSGVESGAPVLLYDAAGKLLYAAPLVGNAIELPSTDGVYLLHVGNQVEKIVSGNK